jgi:type III secretion system low calcium response chaperone LcrH/SycD
MDTNANHKPELEFTKQQLKEAESVSIKLLKGTPLFKIQKIPQESMDTIGNLAFQSYSSGDYDKALQLYRLLSLYDHTNSKNFLGVGICMQKAENYEDAVNSYLIATKLNRDSYSAFFNISQCLLALGKNKLATGALEEVIRIGKGKPDVKKSKTYKKAEQLLKGLKM